MAAALREGTVLAVPVRDPLVGLVQHKGILAHAADGSATVIHSSKLYGRVMETSVEAFAAKAIGPVRVVGYLGTLPPAAVVARARSKIGLPWRIDQNCEHFTSWAHGLPPSSPQLRARFGLPPTPHR